MKVFGDERSGNCLKVKWLLDFQGRPYDWQHVDILQGESRTPEFLTMNPAGQVPTVLFADGWSLAQSNAILHHLAEGTDLIPADRQERARMFEWMFWEQYSHEPYLAVRRFQKVYLGKIESELQPNLLERGYAALTVMNSRLETNQWLAASAPSLADLCLLPYTLFAPEGGYDLGSYPAVERWIDRALPAFRVERTP